MFSVTILLTGCQKAEDNFAHWTIPVSDVSFVFINEHSKNNGLFFLTKEESIDLVTAFNSIKKNDIHWDLSNDEGLFGPFYCNAVVVLNNGRQISLGINPWGIIDYMGVHYYTNYQLGYYDVIRELQIKYNFKFEDWEKAIPKQTNYGIAWYCKNDIILNLTCLVNDALRTVGREETYGEAITFEDLLKPHLDSLKLNDVVEIENMIIKVIEIKDNKRITALAVHFVD